MSHPTRLEQRITYNHQLGGALNYGELATKSLDDQTMLETYYRLKLTANLAVLPNVQYYCDPVLNSEDNSPLIYGV